MSNLITLEEKQQVKREYRFRVVVTGVMFIFVILLISVVSLLPSYFNVIVSERIARATLENLQNEAREEGDDEASRVLSRTNKLLTFLNSKDEQRSLVEVVAEVLDRKPSDVDVLILSFDSVGENTTLIVSGRADTRDTLRGYSASLVEDAGFSGADIPAGDLARTTNLTFRMTIQGDF